MQSVREWAVGASPAWQYVKVAASNCEERHLDNFSFLSEARLLDRGARLR